MKAERIGPGCFRVTHDGRHETVYVAGTEGRRWAFWNGRVFREEAGAHEDSGHGRRHGAVQHIVAPMPATVLKVLASPGRQVRRGDTLVIVEAMKMELPLRAATDAVVRAVRCREGELVPPDAVLVELE